MTDRPAHAFLISNRPPRWKSYLRLGRVSNLPTVWTNVLAGMLLGGAPLDGGVFVSLAACASAAYVAGMWLNDAFDREVDRRMRPERPIPSGHVSATEVFVAGFALLAGSVVGIGVTGVLTAGAWAGPFLSGALLATCVVVYDVWHKNNPVSPVVMGACRASVYLCAALAGGGTATAALWLGAAGIWAYVVGLTFVARQENRNTFAGYSLLLLLLVPAVSVAWLRQDVPSVWVALGLFLAWVAVAAAPLFVRDRPEVGRSVVRLIAGIALLDGLFVATHGSAWWVVVGPAGLIATLSMQRVVRGT